MNDRRAGRSTRDLAARRRKVNIQILVGGLVALLVLLLVVLNSEALGIGGGGVLLLVAVAWFIMRQTETESRKMEKMERRAIRGAKAEERVASILDDLGEDFLVLHDVPSPYGNIDHIVISRQSGIFLIETKAHGGRVSIVEGQLLVNGHVPEKNFITQTLKNTFWLRDEIQRAADAQAWIIPLIVFTNAFVEPGPPIKNVLVVSKKYLPTVLRRSDGNRHASAIWDRRERIQSALYSVEEVV